MSSLRLRSALGLMMALSLAMSPRLASAQSPSEHPKFEDLSAERQSELASLLELARNNEKRDNYAKALQYYQEAFKLFPHPKLYYSMAVCYDRTADVANALRYYKLFIKELPDAPELTRAQQRVDELSQSMVRQETSLRIDSSPPGAAVYLEDITRGPVGSTPTTDLPVSPGIYKVIIKLDGYEDLIQEVEVKPSQRASVKFPLKRLPNVEGPKKAREPSGPVAPWILLGVGVLATGSAVTFAYLENDLIDQVGSEEKSAYTEEEWKTKNTYNTLTWVSAAAAVLSVSGAVLLWVIDDSPSHGSMWTHPEDKATVKWPSLWAAPGAAGLSIEANF